MKIKLNGPELSASHLPETAIAWRELIVGVLLTAALLMVGKLLIGLYLGNSATVSSFAAVGSLIVILLCVHYCSQIFFFGSEFTRVYVERSGSHSQEEVIT